MNILFLTLAKFNALHDRGIYQDLIRKFCNEGHNVTVVSPIERREKGSSDLVEDGNLKVLKVKTLNITKTNILEKTISTLTIERLYLLAIKKYCSDVKFDMVLYSTPPITFAKVIEYIKKRDRAYSYLLLKDIFPQNAIDLGMIRKGSLIHKKFIKKEKNLYNLSDTIGCMSQANLEFILKNNREINSEKVEVNPNTIEPIEIHYSDQQIKDVRMKYNIPLDKRILVYGGNLGKPQGLDFLLQTIDKCENKNVYFLVIGDGTEYNRIRLWFESKAPKNAKLFQRLPKEDYEKLLAACDVGLIFLDKNFKIPNFPSRLLAYLQVKKPVIAATDPNSDIGDVVEQANCGFKVLAGDLSTMLDRISTICDDDLLFKEMSENAHNLLMGSYTVNKSYDLIIEKINK